LNLSSSDNYILILLSQLKKGMRLAPVTRHALEMGDKSAIDEGLQSQAADKLYLQLLKENLVEPKKSGKTFYVDKKDSNDDDEVTVLGI